MHPLNGEPERDPELASHLAELRRAPALTPPEWDSLRRRISSAAELPLARRRRARRLRSGILWGAPSAIAAGIALVLVVNGVGTGGSGADPARSAGTAPRVEELLQASYPVGEVESLLRAGAEADVLLLAALGEIEPREF